MIPLTSTEAGRALRRAPVVHLHFPTRPPVRPTPLSQDALRVRAAAGPPLRLVIDNRAAVAPTPMEAA